MLADKRILNIVYDIQSEIIISQPPEKCKRFFPVWTFPRPVLQLIFHFRSIIIASVYDIQKAGALLETLELLPVRIKITSILRKAIYAGEYKSGDELSLTEIAAQLGVSRTPVREAFQVLESEGLITLRMNKGAIVNTIDRKFIRDIFEMRMLLESQAAYLAAENGMEEEKLGKLLERLYHLRDHWDTLNVSEYVALNQAVHQAIWQAADNHQLTNYLLELWNGPSVGHGENAAEHHYQASTFEHIAVLEAIRNGQKEEAKKAMLRHIGRSMENMLARYPEA